MILVQHYVNLELVDNWYIKDTVYPGTLVFDDYEEARAQAARESYDLKVEEETSQYRGIVILCHETLTPKSYNTDETTTI